MTKEDALHLQIKSRFTDFLKAAELPYWEPALTVCPHCGEHAGILMDFMWSCQHCNKRGDVVDYVMALEHLETKMAAIKRVCRALQIKVTTLEVISADAPCNPATFRDHFKKALEEIPGVRVLTPHSCRHTYVSQMQALGVDLATIQSIVGHADIDMTQHYLHVQESIRQDAIARFSKAFTSDTTDPDKPTDGACKVLKFPKVG